MRHLSENGPATIHDTAAALSRDLGLDQLLVEEAMCDMIDHSQLKRMAGPEGVAPGKIDGKYAPYNQKRMDDSGISPKSGTFEDPPAWRRDIKGPIGV
jgi:hypothetical protein